jgi:hypothetical protein
MFLLCLDQALGERVSMQVGRESNNHFSADRVHQNSTYRSAYLFRNDETSTCKPSQHRSDQGRKTEPTWLNSPIAKLEHMANANPTYLYERSVRRARRRRLARVTTCSTDGSVLNVLVVHHGDEGCAYDELGEGRRRRGISAAVCDLVVVVALVCRPDSIEALQPRVELRGKWRIRLLEATVI